MNSSTKTIFKHADTSDLTYIQEIAYRTVDRSYRYFLSDMVVDDYLNRGLLKNYLRNNSKYIWILTVDEKILGFSICIDNVIDFMMIDVDFHHQGLGTQLLQYCESMLFENNKVIALESYEQNTKACDFYKANDWLLTEKYRDSKQGAIKLIFRKQLHTEEELLRNSTHNFAN